MEVIYNHLFFPQQHNSIDFNINDFSSIMYPADLQKPILEDKKVVQEEKKVVQEEKPVIKKKVVEYIVPKQQDSLFWCFFICAFGYDEYVMVNRNYGVKELEIKQKASEYLSTNPNEIKNTNYKITKTLIQEIMSDLNTTLNTTSFHALLALISKYKFNVYILHNEKRCYLPFIYDRSAPTFLFKKMEYNKYSVKLDKLSRTELEELDKNYYGLESYLRPIKAISNYKVKDLHELAEKLQLTDFVFLKKQELYDCITNLLSWY